MSIHRAEAFWQGNLQDGQGKIKLTKSNFECDYSFPSRFEDGKGSSPEELIAAAHSTCFSMALSDALSEAGFIADQIHTIASVMLDKVGEGFQITKINLTTQIRVNGIKLGELMKIAETVQKECPVSKALKGVDIKLDVELMD